MAPGTYDVTLNVTDSAGASASDTKKVVVYEPVEATLLDETRNDPTPGVLSVGVPGTINFEFDVPVNTTGFHVHVDVGIRRPTTTTSASSTRAETEVEDSEATPRPVYPRTLTWSIRSPGRGPRAVDKFATVTDNVRVTVIALVPPADPRPNVRAGGPYKIRHRARRRRSPER